MARAFAREGARVFLAGRTLAPLDRVAEEIRAAGGVAETAHVDALDERAVDEHADAVAEQAGGIDISFNAIFNQDVQGRPLIEMPFEDFARPVANAMRNQFLTTRAVARHMTKRGSGVILTIASGTREPFPTIGGTIVAGSSKASAGSGRPNSGGRVSASRGCGRPAYPSPFLTPATPSPTSATRDEIIAGMRDETMLKRLPTLADVGNVAGLCSQDRLFSERSLRASPEGVALGTVATFAQLSGSRRGDTGLLFDPDTQPPKVIAVWKEIEPLPRVIETPAVILVGMVAFGIAYAFLYRSVASAWPVGIHSRAWRLALVVWLAAVFSEFMGPFNVLHQPLQLSAVAWGFWAVSAVAEAYAVVYVLDRGRSGGAGREDALRAGRPQVGREAGSEAPPAEQR